MYLIKDDLKWAVNIFWPLIFFALYEYLWKLKNVYKNATSFSQGVIFIIREKLQIKNKVIIKA